MEHVEVVAAMRVDLSVNDTANRSACPQ